MSVARLQLPFGPSLVGVQIPAALLLGVLTPRESARAFDEHMLLREALAHPVGTPRLRDLARAGQKVVIVTSDLTRPCPSDRLLPSVLDELTAAGVPDVGNSPPPPPRAGGGPAPPRPIRPPNQRTRVSSPWAGAR